MRRISGAVFVFFLLCISNLGADEPKKSPDKTAPVAATKSWEERNLDQPYLVLNDEQETHLNKDWTYETVNHYVLKIQKESAKDLGEMPIYYNKSKEKINSIEAFVITPSGEKLSYTKVQDLAVYQGSPMYSDFRVKIVTFPQVSIGSVIDLKVKGKTFSKQIDRQFWDFVPYPDVPTKVYKNVYTFPEGMNIAYHDYKIEHKPAITRNKGQITYTFKNSETEDIHDEEYSPPDYEVFGFSMFSSIKDWNAVADWYRQLVQKNAQSDDKMKKTVGDLTKGKKNDKEKVKSILEYLQDNFRYVSMSFGNNAVEPHPAAEIFKNQYGDCKDWSLLVKTMLKLAGISSNICLFSSEFDGNPQEDLPNASAFNHVILEIQMDKEKMFVDPLLKGYDFGQYPSSYQGAHLFVIEDDGYRFDTLPIAAEDQYSIESNADVNVNPDGSALYTIDTVWGIDLSLPVKEQWKSTTDQQKEKFYNTMDQNFTKGGEMLERRWDGMDERYGKLKSFLKFKRPNAYPLLNNMIILNEKADAHDSEFVDKERKYPIFFPLNSIVKGAITYHIPEGYAIDFVPENYELKNEIVEVSKKFEVKDARTLTVTDIYRTKRAIVAAEKYKDVKALWNDLAKKNDKYIVLKKLDQDQKKNQ